VIKRIRRCCAAVIILAVVAGSFPTGIDARQPDALRVVNLRVEYKKNPLGIDDNPPRLSWQLTTRGRGVDQVAYQIRVAARIEDLSAHPSFDSGKVVSNQSVHVPYAGAQPQSRQRYYWQVRVWDNEQRLSDWSEPAYWEMGLLLRSAWKAQWIGPGLPRDKDQSGAAPLLRSEFKLKGQVVQARAYVTGEGLYELYLNGTRVGDQLFTPGWTSYTHRLQYQTYDVTTLLKKGGNAVGAVLGDGWYRGTLGPYGQRDHFGSRLRLLVQIEVTMEDGQSDTITTDATWKSATGPIKYSDIYNGETYDARLERKGWASVGYDDRDWHPVSVVEAPSAALIASTSAPVRRIEELIPRTISPTPSGVLVADMGQNMVGWIRLRVRGPAGTTVTLRHGETLGRDGNLYTANLRTAQQTIRYTLKGGEEEVFEPHFTFQGFRYVAIEGYPGKVTTSSITGIVIHSDLEQMGRLETSNQLVNQLQHNIVWTQLNNFLDIPTDCPQRDERLGWAGDAQVFSATAMLNMKSASFYTKWLRDLSSEQVSNGAIPWESPNIVQSLVAKHSRLSSGEITDGTGAAAWSDAATIIPWNVYLYYGDVGLVAAQYGSMRRWVEYERARAGSDNIWRGDFQFGDWLDLVSTNEHSDLGGTSPDLVATAYYAHSVDILRRAAEVVGKPADKAEYDALFRRIRNSFAEEFVSADGKVGNGTQTGYVLALDFDLLPEQVLPLAAQKLVQDLRSRGHLTTGLLGTGRILNVLSRFEQVDEAYNLLTRTDFPSWLYPVVHGATTVWERWDGIKPDGTFQSMEMNSFDHYGLGSVGQWLYEGIAGIKADPSEPGYKHSVIAPMIGGGLTYAIASLETMYGQLISAWRIREGRFTLHVVVPPNTRATIALPNATLGRVAEGGKPMRADNAVTQLRDRVILEIGSGDYSFSYLWDVSTLDHHAVEAMAH
jgi:alpha-L-rhamnosidase